MVPTECHSQLAFPIDQHALELSSAITLAYFRVSDAHVIRDGEDKGTLDSAWPYLRFDQSALIDSACEVAWVLR